MCVGRVVVLRETQSHRRAECGEACRLVVLQMQVVVLLHADRGPRLLNVEIFVELLLRWLRSVDVMRERFEGRSRGKLHGGLLINTCSNMQVAGAAASRLQHVSLGGIISGSLSRSAPAPTVTCIPPMTIKVSKAATMAFKWRCEWHVVCIVLTKAFRLASVITSELAITT